jgi:hypothetical protein
MARRYSDETVCVYLAYVFAKLLSGRAPEISRAERVVPIDRPHLSKTRLFGGAVFATNFGRRQRAWPHAALNAADFDPARRGARRRGRTRCRRGCARLGVTSNSHSTKWALRGRVFALKAQGSPWSRWMIRPSICWRALLRPGRDRGRQQLSLRVGGGAPSEARLREHVCRTGLQSAKDYLVEAFLKRHYRLI